MTNNAEREAFEKWCEGHMSCDLTHSPVKVGYVSQYIDDMYQAWHTRAQASGVPDGWQEALEKVAQEWDCRWEDAKDFFFDAIRAWRPDDTHLLIARDELISRDDYGVYGSDFYICKLCGKESGAGVLNKGIEHEDSCRLNPINSAPAPPKSTNDPDNRLVRRGYHVAREIIESLRASAVYVDEEGEDTDALEAFIESIAAPKSASVPVERLEALHTRFDNAELEERACSGEYASGRAGAFAICARDLAELIAEYKV